MIVLSPFFARAVAISNIILIKCINWWFKKKKITQRLRELGVRRKGANKTEARGCPASLEDVMDGNVNIK